MLGKCQRHNYNYQLPVSCSHSFLRLSTSRLALDKKWEKKSIFVPSSEQQEVVKLCAVQNVVVSARPGSGKTAVAEAIIAAYPELRAAVVTFRAPSTAKTLSDFVIIPTVNR